MSYRLGMRVNITDGGRAAAGFKGDTRDCVTRSIAIATGRDYQEIYDEINEAAKAERPKAASRRSGRSSSRTGVHTPTVRKYLDSLGWEWRPKMKIGSGCTTHLRADELPGGTLIVKVSKHITCVMDGEIYDDHDPQRDGMRCVYGYWQQRGSW